MSPQKEIHENVVGGRYYFVILVAVLVLLNEFVPFVNLVALLVIFAFLSIILYSNRKISSNNLGAVAILHMVLIVGMIGFYDYLSGAFGRLIFVLNFALGSACALSCYGLYFNARGGK
ncbi:hypothetical protein ACIGHN_00015 [Acidovorax sp. NPDC077693]|uniref:hypothetical protein n=1 Tax=unclassified Acidovorax TaxID=2684926 RepID=UPI000AB8BCCD|nr:MULTISPECIES: hypothetical protein [unclassified Acidovorax]